MASIQLKDIQKSFSDLQVIKGIDLDIREGELVVLVGPSGCGKSTLLRILAGLEDADSGSVFIDGADVTDRLPSERGLSMVFQSYALYPHMTVSENIGFALKTAGMAKHVIASRVQQVAKILQLEPELDRLPKQLSGGQRQRVAIGRAIVREPNGFLFDEPLSNLDAALRANMRLEISRLQKQLGVTTVYVTHDQVEAMTLADRIVVLNEGTIMQAGSPRELYTAPRNKFVAEFIGSPKMNIARCEVNNTSVSLLGTGTILKNLLTEKAEAVWLGVRPEHIQVCDKAGASLCGTVAVVEYLGSEQFAYVDCGLDEMITVSADPSSEIVLGAEVGISLDPNQIHFFDRNERRI